MDDLKITVKCQRQPTAATKANNV